MSIASALSRIWGKLFGGGSQTPRPPLYVDQRTQTDIDLTPKGTNTIEDALKSNFRPAVSSWVVGYRWERSLRNPQTGTLFVKFLDGAVCAYDGIEEKLYDEMFAAGSKGRFVHMYLYNRPYRLVQKGAKAGIRKQRR